MNIRSKYEKIISDLQDHNDNLDRFKNAHSKNELELHSIEQKLDDAKFNQVKLEDKLREKEREILQLNDKLNNTTIFYPQDRYDGYNDANYNVKSALNQKQEEITALMAENKTLKLKLSTRPESYTVNELERKISEQENIIHLQNNEIETLKIQQDTKRLHNIMVKTTDSYNNTNLPTNKSVRGGSLNRSHGSINVGKNQSNSFVVKSHISREKMRRDKMLKELKQIQHYDQPNYETLKRLFKQLMEIFGTEHIGEMIEQAKDRKDKDEIEKRQTDGNYSKF